MDNVGPIVVVAAAIIRSSRVLLAKRFQPELPGAHLKWELPGGKVEFEEDPREALKREIREELNVDISVLRLLPHVQSNIYYSRKSATHIVVLAFECVLSNSVLEPCISESEVDEIIWVDRALLESQSLELLPGTLDFVCCLEWFHLLIR